MTLSTFSDTGIKAHGEGQLNYGSEGLFADLASGTSESKQQPKRRSNNGPKKGPTRPPPSFDWRKRHGNIMTKVKDQVWCKATYAFAATAVLEAFMKWKHNQTYDLSEQSVIDCTHLKYDYGRENRGCLGGIPSSVLLYFNDTGLITEKEYPYVSGNTEHPEACKAKPKTNFPKGHLNVRTVFKEDETDLMALLVEKGPFIISLPFIEDVEERFLDVYDEVFFDWRKPQPTEEFTLYHVVVVGYGTSETNKPYWTVRSSWGTGWGENGYGKIRRGVNLMNFMESGATFVQELKKRDKTKKVR